MTVPYARNLFLAAPMMRGSDVLAVQQALSAITPGLAADGVFGQATAGAVRAFQTRLRLDIDGIVGVDTWTRLFGAAPLSPAGTPQPGGDRASEAFRILQADGWSPEQACGVLGNIQHESAFRPSQYGDGGLAYGLAQWHPDRQAGFQVAMNRPIQGSSLADQVKFITIELSGAEKSAGRRLKAATTPAAAAEIVCRYYERPAQKDSESIKRGRTAQTFFAALTATPPTSPAGLTATDPAPLDVLSPRIVEDLTRPHFACPGGVTWRLTPAGVEVDGQPISVDTIAVNRMESLCRQYAEPLARLLGTIRVPLELVLAALDVAAGRTAQAQRLPGCDTLMPERTPGKLTAGPMQAILSVARVAMANPAFSLQDLEHAETGLLAGIKAMRLQGAATLFDPPLVAAAHAAGALFLDPSPTNRWRLAQGPGPAGLIDRFVTAFNAAVQVTAAARILPGTTTVNQALETISTPGERRTHDGPFIAADPLHYVGGPFVDTGQCVALVQKAAGAPQTALWVQGPAVKGATLEPGTAIATFQHGRYTNDKTGLSHAALYLEEGPNNGVDGIWVIDQWIIGGRHPPQKRHIRFNHPANGDNKPVNRGEDFSVIL